MAFQKWIMRSMLSTKHLRQEMLIAFCLILLTILVLVGCLFPGVYSSWFTSRSTLPVVIGILVAFFVIGFFIILQIVDPIIRITHQTKKIASGDLSREIKLVREDEL